MGKYSKIIVSDTVKEMLDSYTNWHTRVFNANPEGVTILSAEWNKYKYRNSYKLYVTYECRNEVN